jgi:hypothetical protein
MAPGGRLLRLPGLIPRGPDEDPLVVNRWDYEPAVWQRPLGEHGYIDARDSAGGASTRARPGR